MYMYVCMHMYACMCVCMYVSVCMCVCVCIHVYVCITYWGGIVRGKCPTQSGRGNCTGVIVREEIVWGELSRGNCRTPWASSSISRKRQALSPCVTCMYACMYVCMYECMYV